MLKRGLLSLALVFVLVMSFCGASYADIMPPSPIMTLTVQQSPLDIYPPMMIYTAKLSFVPTGTLIKVDFYNAKDTDPSTTYQYIGSSPADSTGKAVFNAQMYPGAYRAIAKTIVNGVVVSSNEVYYKVQ